MWLQRQQSLRPSFANLIHTVSTLQYFNKLVYNISRSHISWLSYILLNEFCLWINYAVIIKIFPRKSREKKLFFSRCNNFWHSTSFYCIFMTYLPYIIVIKNKFYCVRNFSGWKLFSLLFIHSPTHTHFAAQSSIKIALKTK